MKRVSLLLREPSGGPDRHITSASSPHSLTASRRPISSRGSTRTKQRSDIFSSLAQDSLAEVGTTDGTMDETQASLTLVDEELRQSAERQARRQRQLQTREVRQRAVLLEEEAQSMEKIVTLHVAYSTIAATCAGLQAARAAARLRDAAQSQQWSLQLLADAVQDVVRRERTSRKAVQHAEAAVRATVVQLRAAEARGLDLHEGAFRLVHAEQVRRAFVLREEARAVEALQIPRFIALPCVTTSTSGSATHSARDVDKLGLMAEERCPFKCAADCPYMPGRTRHLGKLWANAGSDASRRGRAAAAAAAPGREEGQQQQQQQRQRGVTEVGRQRVRYAMAQEHYRETPNFLPLLHIA